MATEQVPIPKFMNVKAGAINVAGGRAEFRPVMRAAQSDASGGLPGPSQESVQPELHTLVCRFSTVVDKEETSLTRFEESPGHDLVTTSMSWPPECSVLVLII